MNSVLNTQITITSALDSISEALIIVDKNFHLLFQNEATKVLFGINWDCEPKNWAQEYGFFKEDAVSLLSLEEMPMYKAMQGKEIKNFPAFVKTAHQGGIMVSINANPIYDGGEIVGAIVTARDKTEVRKLESAIRKERSFYSEILDSIPAYVFAKDLSGKYTYLNKMASRRLRRNNTLQDLVTDEDLGKFLANEKLVIRSKEAMQFEQEFFDASLGRRVSFRTSLFPLLDESGECYGISCVAYDLSQEIEQRNQLDNERAKMASASKLAALGLMAAEIGHEINNPMAIIRTSTWILRRIIVDKEFPEEMAISKLDEIDDTVQRINLIVRSLRNVSRDSSQDKKSDYFLSDIITDIQSLCGLKFRQKGINFILDKHNPYLQDKIVCMRVQISEVLINLLVNAIDAVETLPSPWVRLDIQKTDDSFILRVTDSGPGVPKEIEHKIFVPFFSTKDIGKGTGLGLSISKEILKRHGGELSLNRKISANCFELILPL